MRKPKFLQHFLNKKKERELEQQCEIDALKLRLSQQDEQIVVLANNLRELQTEKNIQRMEEEKEEEERTNPYKADEWKVVYDAQNKLSTVYLNGQELYGTRSFSFDLDGTQTGLYKDCPIIDYEGYGSIEVITESE